MRLEGKVALITGSGRGIGRTMALLFGREGADIAVNDIDLPSAEKTAEEIRQMGRKASAIKADVGNPDDVSTRSFSNSISDCFSLWKGKFLAFLASLMVLCQFLS
jgi:NAD(P)-dependent dehydrogenase (short-subunit alcohol dehydrogenase family)